MVYCATSFLSLLLIERNRERLGETVTMLSLGRISCNPTLSGLDSEGDIDGKWQKNLSGLAVFC